METNFLDRTIMKPFVAITPKFISPNIITVFRFICVPIVIYFLLIGSYKIGAIIFMVAAFSDAIDGALARTRSQITDFGKLFDPLADKLLIISVGAIMMIKFLPAVIFITILFIELVIIAESLYYKYSKHLVVQANVFGKIKMTLQCVGLILIFINSIFYANSVLILTASIILWLAIIFAIASLVYGRIKGSGSL